MTYVKIRVPSFSSRMTGCFALLLPIVRGGAEWLEQCFDGYGQATQALSGGVVDRIGT